MADQLCTLADVRTRLRLAAGDVADDALITDLIEGVTDWVEDATKRKLVPDNAATYVIDTVRGSEIYVRRGIRTVTSLSIATTDQPDAGGVYTALAASLITLRPATMDRRIGWPADRIVILGSTPPLQTAINGASIVGNFGFAAVPPTIKLVAIDAVVAAYGARGKPQSAALGADNRATYPWVSFFSEGSPQAATIARFRGPLGIA